MNKKIEAMVSLICEMVGITEIPSKILMDQLIDYILNDLNRFTLDDILKAGRMYSTGRMRELEHFNKFSLKFFSSLMQEYSKLTFNKRTDHMLAEKNELTPKEKDHIMLMSLKELIQQTKDGTATDLRYSPGMFLWLEGLGIIDLSIEYKLKKYEKAKEDLLKFYQDKATANKIYLGFMRDFANHIVLPSTESTLRNMARRDCLMDFIVDCIDLDRDIIKEAKEVLK